MSGAISSVLPPNLFDRRLIVVTGKGGVGKSTLAAAIGFAAARRGKRACVVELYGQSRIAAMFGLEGRSYAPRGIGHGVDLVSLTVAECLDDFGHRKLKMDALVRLMLTNRVVTAFLDSVPGLHDLLQLGKIENMAMDPAPGEVPYDVVILDAPSTGHGLTLLQAARAMTETSRVGPFHDLAAMIERTFGDPVKSAIVLVTLAEDLPVNETFEFIEALGEDQTLLGAIIANRVCGTAVPEGPAWDAMKDRLNAATDPDLRQLVLLARKEIDRQDAERDALARLAGKVSVPLVRLPRVDVTDRAVAIHRLGGMLVGEGG